MNRTLHCETVYHLKNELEMGSGLQFGQGMPPTSTITREFVDALLDHYQTFISFPEREAEHKNTSINLQSILISLKLLVLLMAPTLKLKGQMKTVTIT